MRTFYFTRLEKDYDGKNNFYLLANKALLIEGEEIMSKIGYKFLPKSIKKLGKRDGTIKIILKQKRPYIATERLDRKEKREANAFLQKLMYLVN